MLFDKPVAILSRERWVKDSKFGMLTPAKFFSACVSVTTVVLVTYMRLTSS